MTHKGEILSSGDSFTIQAKVEDPSGVRSLSVNVIGPSIEYGDTVYNAETGYYEVTFTFADTDIVGRYYVYSIDASDIYSNYSSIVEGKSDTLNGFEVFLDEYSHYRSVGSRSSVGMNRFPHMMK
jgi:hypothetical protein